MTTQAANKRNKKSVSLSELRKIIADAQDQIQAVSKTAKVELRNRIISEVAEEGFTIKELFETRYVNPDNPQEFWTGKGPYPPWFKAKLDAEKTKLGKKFNKEVFLASLDESPALYRNPDNKSQEWSGIGQPPKWLATKLKKGVTLEELAV